ncbi:hypothetical protein TNCV_712701 [Trichonephila clavipes]|nr:hypothetical protein TNCV_712701 [Trichonephila clavipes]
MESDSLSVLSALQNFSIKSHKINIPPEVGLEVIRFHLNVVVYTVELVHMSQEFSRWHWLKERDRRKAVGIDMDSRVLLDTAQQAERQMSVIYA